MQDDEVKRRLPPGWRPTRRDVLRLAAGAAAGILAVPPARGQASRPATHPALERCPPPWWLEDAARRSRVVDVRSARVLAGSAIDQAALAEMVTAGICDLVGKPTPTEAWQTLLGPARQLGIKFNSVGARVVGTNEALARALVTSLIDAGYQPREMSLIEVPKGVAREFGTKPVREGWAGTVAVGDARDEVAQYLSDAEAVINVPLLKTHQIAGMSGALKNISHAVVRHPARYHADGCSPFVPQIFANKEISGKIRLNLTNALRVVIRHGPDARPQDLVDHGGLLFATDPVAADTVGQGLLAAYRRKAALPDSLHVAYLEAAAEMGLGRRALHELEHVPVRIA
jgi:hypothetical protein